MCRSEIPSSRPSKEQEPCIESSRLDRQGLKKWMVIAERERVINHRPNVIMFSVIGPLDPGSSASLYGCDS